MAAKSKPIFVGGGIDIIGGLVDWLIEHDSNLKFERGTTDFSHGNYLNSWFNVRSLHGKMLGQVTLIYPGRIPPGLQYDFGVRDHELLYCRHEWLNLCDPSVFAEILATAQALRDEKPVAWHKYFRYKPGSSTIHRVKDTSWPPKFM
jgi:hypothetical protein